MEHKSVNFIIQGMQRDLSVARFDQNFAYENMNIRITAIDDKSLLSITNEKGNKKIVAKDSDNKDLAITGNYIGHCTVGKYLVIFTTSTSLDYIYKFYFKDGTLYGDLISSGNLNFSEDYPIEAIGIYESESIQKIYWVDGNNPARYLNIMSTKYNSSLINSTVFDFTGEVPFPTDFTVSKYSNTQGTFQSGIIQYTFSLYDNNGRESNLIDVSPILYITHSDRGGNAETICNNSFKISIKGINNGNYNYDYLRIYSIHRSSLNATPTVKQLVDLKLNHNSTLQDFSYIDTGLYGTIVDPYELLYKGGDTLIPNTLVQKDNTLFLGNFKSNSTIIDADIKEAIKSSTISFSNKYVEILKNENAYYSYKFQLDKDSSYITTFKQGETYRFGIQLQDNTGKWSEIIYIGDKEVPYMLSGEETFARLIEPTVELSSEAIELLEDSKYVKIRGVVVHPQEYDRTIVAQGMLCPTVFNLSTRLNGGAFAQSSWFARPFAPEVVNDSGTTTNENNALNGSTLEFRHEYLVPLNNGKRNMEIGVLPKYYNDAYNHPWGSIVKNNYSYENSLHYVDQNIVTFHSPEIAFENLSQSNEMDLKLRIVGYIPLTAFVSDISINLESAGYNSAVRDYVTVGVNNASVHGYKSLASGLFFTDKKYVSDDNIEGGDPTTFLVFPWHRNGSLNNFPKTSGEQPRNAVLKNKKMSNLKYSNNTIYFKSVGIDNWEAYITGDQTKTGITPVSLFNSDQNTITKIKSPTYSGLQDIIYLGNVDTILTGVNKIYTQKYDAAINTRDPYNISGELEVLDTVESADPVSMKYKSTPHAVFAFNYTNTGSIRTLPAIRSLNATTRTDNPVWITGNSEIIGYYLEELSSSTRSDYEITYLYYRPNVEDIIEDVDTPISFYDSKFWVPEGNSWRELKSVQDGAIASYRDVESDKVFYYTVRAVKSISNTISTDSIDIESEYGGLYLAELYRDIDDDNKFGGKTQSAIEDNLWLPAGKSSFISDLANSNKIKYTEGDTYYQRFDCLKTYAYTNEDQNSIIEIVSFMCETRVNIDGRWDRNRGQINNLNVSPTNFNLFNTVYNQKNNFFTYRVLSDDFNQTDFPTSITWSLTKTLGEKIDSWTRFNLTSLLDLDGNNGKLQKLQLYNNEIFSFQDKGIAKILFNSRVQIPTSEGVPIEIANSGKVDGRVYITQEVGTINKWSVITTPNGTYFIDNNNLGIYNLSSNGLVCISDKFNMSSIIKEHSSMKSWNPKDFGNFRCFYDRINSDVYFINKDVCFCFNELLGQFTSFYNYESTPMMCNIEDRFLSFKNSNLWEFFAGDYNSFYGKIKPFYITYIANPEPTKDKIFNNLEFRADTFSGDTLLNRTFDTLEVWNEYQVGRSKLANLVGPSSNLKRKFRIWRAQIPRNNGTLQRIRNPWCFIKLSMENPSNYKTIFYDSTLSYSV